MNQFYFANIALHFVIKHLVSRDENVQLNQLPIALSEVYGKEIKISFLITCIHQFCSNESNVNYNWKAQRCGRWCKILLGSFIFVLWGRNLKRVHILKLALSVHATMSAMTIIWINLSLYFVPFVRCFYRISEFTNSLNSMPWFKSWKWNWVETDWPRRTWC